jgi:hypothetical protein
LVVCACAIPGAEQDSSRNLNELRALVYAFASYPPQAPKAIQSRGGPELVANLPQGLKDYQS